MKKILLDKKSALAIGMLLLLCFIFSQFFLHKGDTSYSNPDEVIVVEMVKHLNQSNSMDANWANGNLPSHFKYDQYNFTSYIYFVYFSQKVLSAFSNEIFSDQNAYGFTRSLSGIQLCLIVLVSFFLARKFMPIGYAVFSALITIFSIQLQQDALYARPESFFTLLTIIICLLLTQIDKNPKLTYGISSFLTGILAACKISAVFLYPFIIVLFLMQYRKNLFNKESLTVAGLFAFFSLAGLLFGNPYIFLNFEGWMNGLNFLLNQYSSSHLPHGLPDASIIGRLKHAVHYLISTNGIVLVFFLLGTVFSAIKKNCLMLLFCCMAIFNMLYFSIKPVFFERNISHILPLIYLGAIYGLTSLLNNIKAPLKYCAPILLIAILFTPINNFIALKKAISPEFTATKVVQMKNKLEDGYKSRIYDFGYLLSPSEIKSLIERASSTSFLLYQIYHPGDPYTQSNINYLLSEGYFTIAGIYEGVFSSFPSSTLQTYLNSNVIFLLKNDKKLSFQIEGFEQISDHQWKHKNSQTMIHLSTGWSKNSYYPDTPQPQNSLFTFGSWLGSDGSTGEISISFSNDDCKKMQLGIFTGPDHTNLRVEILNKKARLAVKNLDLDSASKSWVYFPLHEMLLDSTCDDIVILANDNGTNWGQWLAIALTHY